MSPLKYCRRDCLVETDNKCRLNLTEWTRIGRKFPFFLRALFPRQQMEFQ